MKPLLLFLTLILNTSCKKTEISNNKHEPEIPSKEINDLTELNNKERATQDKLEEERTKKYLALKNIRYYTTLSDVVLSFEDSKDVNEKLGIKLLNISDDSATILVIKDNKKDQAKLDQYFTGGSFGRRGLKLTKINKVNSTITLQRMSSFSSLDLANPKNQ